MKDQKIDRRTFIKRAGAAGIAISLAGKFGFEPLTQAAPKDSLPTLIPLTRGEITAQTAYRTMSLVVEDGSGRCGRS